MTDGIQMFEMLACPACRFDSGSSVTTAANLAVAFMGVVLAGVLGSILAFVWRMVKLERSAAARGAAGISDLDQT